MFVLDWVYLGSSGSMGTGMVTGMSAGMCRGKHRCGGDDAVTEQTVLLLVLVIL